MEIIKTHLLDTSALIKLVIVENGSIAIRNYFDSESVFWTTSICFAEALGVLKTMHFYREEISNNEYLISTENLVAYLRNKSISIEDSDFTNYTIYNEVEKISKQYELDIADAFQLATLKIGFPSNLEGESKTILITADKDLSKAARNENIKAWYIIDEPAPT